MPRLVNPQKATKIKLDVQRSKEKLDRTMLTRQVPDLRLRLQDIRIQMATANGPEREVLKAEMDYVNKKIKAAQSGVPIKEAKQGLDAIKSSWIDKIAGKGHAKDEVKKFVMARVKELEDQYPDNYSAIVGTLKKILQGKYKDVNLEEEAGGAITTANIGAATRIGDSGQSEPAPFGSSHIYAPKAIKKIMTRYGDLTKKRKRTYKEFIENYGENLSL